MKFSVALLCFVAVFALANAKFVDDKYYVAMENRETAFQNNELRKLEHDCKHAKQNYENAAVAEQWWRNSLYKWTPKATSAQQRHLAQTKYENLLRDFKASYGQQKYDIQRSLNKLLSTEFKWQHTAASRRLYGRNRTLARLYDLSRNCPSLLKAKRQYVSELKERIESERTRRREEAEN